MSGTQSSPYWLFFEIVVFMLFVLLVTGCVSPIPPVNSPVNTNEVTAPQTMITTPPVAPITTSPVATPTQTQCPQERNGSFTITGGDPFSYEPSAGGRNISTVRYWIFGNRYISYGTIPVRQNGSFNFTLNRAQTSAMVKGTYRILFEFPSSGDSFDIRIGYIDKNTGNVLYDRPGIRIINFRDVQTDYLNGFRAADIVEQAIRKTGTESAENITLIVQEPVINFDPVGVHYVGDIIPFSGTTNLPPGEMIRLDIYSAIFVPCDKYPQCNGGDSVRTCCNGISNTVPVRPAECGNNTWSWEVNTSQHQFSSSPLMMSGWNRNYSVYNKVFFELADKPNPTS